MDAITARILDISLNRLKEGLRVCEVYTRQVIGSREWSTSLKTLRHNAETIYPNNIYHEIRAYRNTERDPGRAPREKKSGKDTVYDIAAASFKRVQEAARTLEEFSKPYSLAIAQKWKYMQPYVMMLPEAQLINVYRMTFLLYKSKTLIIEGVGGGGVW